MNGTRIRYVNFDAHCEPYAVRGALGTAVMRASTAYSQVEIVTLC